MLDLRSRISTTGYVRRSVTLLWKVVKWNIYSAKNMAKLIWYNCCALPHLYDTIYPSVVLSVKICDFLSLSIYLFSPRTHRWPLGLVTWKAMTITSEMVSERRKRVLFFIIVDYDIFYDCLYQVTGGRHFMACDNVCYHARAPLPLTH